MRVLIPIMKNKQIAYFINFDKLFINFDKKCSHSMNFTLHLFGNIRVWIPFKHAAVVELVDTPDLGSGDAVV
jgi:hypothetical protein